MVLALVAPLPALCIAVATAVAPYQMSGETSDLLAGAAADPAAIRLSVWLGLLTSLTLIPATIAVIWVCRRRSPRLTSVAAVLSLLGFSAALILPADELVALTTAEEGLDRATVLALIDAEWGQPTVAVALLLFLVGMVIGGILLGIALWRSRTAPRWMALALIVSSPSHVVFGPNALAALSWALAAVGFAGASVALLRTDNDEFDLPPVTARHRLQAHARETHDVTLEVFDGQNVSHTWCQTRRRSHNPNGTHIRLRHCEAERPGG
jgi:Domain of unknown function (DUF4386)